MISLEPRASRGGRRRRQPTRMRRSGMREDRKERAICPDATTQRATASSAVLSACRPDPVGAIDSGPMFRLLPTETRFFDLFEAQANKVLEAAHALRELVEHYE